MTSVYLKSARLSAVAFLVSATVAAAAGTHSGGHGNDGGHGHGHGMADDIGRPGSGPVDRVIHVDMSEMAFAPGEIEVREGETIRFEISNSGDVVHEFSLGTADMHLGHADEMMRMMDEGFLEVDRVHHDKMASAGMMHDDPNSVLLEPGQTAIMDWTFSGKGALEISCNVPGHRESGMIGRIKLIDSAS